MSYDTNAPAWERELIREPSAPSITIARRGTAWHWELTWMPPCTRYEGDPSRPAKQIPSRYWDCTITKRGAMRAAERAWRLVLSDFHNEQNALTYTPGETA